MLLCDVMCGCFDSSFSCVPVVSPLSEPDLRPDRKITSRKQDAVVKLMNKERKDFNHSRARFLFSNAFQSFVF